MNDPANTGATPTTTALPKRVNDLRGQTFGLLAVLEYAGRAENSGHAMWRVQCSCPTKKIFDVVGTSLRNGDTKSCGCLRVEAGKRNATHGMHGTPEYYAWIAARKRTRDPSHPAYPDYGGRGIGMSDELYDSFPLFFAEIGFRPKQPPKRTVDRKNNSLGYIAGNLKWSTHKEQNRNRRSNHMIDHDGRRLPAIVWAEEAEIPLKTLLKRKSMGWSMEKIMNTPARAWVRKEKAS